MRIYTSWTGSNGRLCEESRSPFRQKWNSHLWIEERWQWLHSPLPSWYLPYKLWVMAICISVIMKLIFWLIVMKWYLFGSLSNWRNLQWAEIKEVSWMSDEFLPLWKCNLQMMWINFLGCLKQSSHTRRQRWPHGWQSCATDPILL